MFVDQAQKDQTIFMYYFCIITFGLFTADIKDILDADNMNVTDQQPHLYFIQSVARR